MAIKKLNPYLNFDGTAGKAIQLYEKALGAKVENLMRFGEAGPMGENTPPEAKDRVLHAALRIGDTGVVMISDGPPGMAIPTESNAHVMLDFDDEKDMARAFETLGSGGKVTMPLQDMFWGARFGMLTDAFGIRWMMNCEKRKG
jgi:PhnB protein